MGRRPGGYGVMVKVTDFVIPKVPEISALTVTADRLALSPGSAGHSSPRDDSATLSSLRVYGL